MTYTLWDIETSNQFGQFDDEHEVLALVRTLVGHFGAQYADELVLGRETADGRILKPLSGEALIARAGEVLGVHGDAGEDLNAFMEARGQNREIA